MIFPDILTDEDMQLMLKELTLMGHEPLQWDSRTDEVIGLVDKDYKEWGNFHPDFTYVLHVKSGKWVRVNVMDSAGFAGITSEKAHELVQEMDLE